MKHVVLITTLLMLSLTGCMPLSEGRNLAAQATPALTVASVTAVSVTPTFVEATETPTTTATVTNTAPPLPSPIATATELPTNTPMPALLATTAIEQRCSVSEPVQVEQTDLAQGLVFVKIQETNRSIAVLGDESLQNPVWHYTYPDDYTFSAISPDGNWIAFMTYHAIDRDKDIFAIDMRVTDWRADQEFQAQFENLTLSRFADIEWINDSRIVFPLAHEGELFHWLVWDPFSGEEKTLSVELTGIGNHMEYFQVFPTLDPQLEFVAYPCEHCGQAEYAVRNLESGEITWSIDLGLKPSYAYRGSVIWSPNGEYVAVVGGRNLILNGLWIFNRRGEIVHEIVLPDIGGIVAAENLTWSPSGEYLAFSRGSYNTEGTIISTLSYVSLVDGSVIDLCLDIQTGLPIWSPDSTKIAFSRQIQSHADPRLISIVDIASGEVTQLYDGDGNSLVDWIPIPGD